MASTAELALALTLDVLRNVSESTIEYRAGDEPAQHVGAQLRGRTAGVIGYGSVGRYLAESLRGLGVVVVVHDPHIDATADGFEQLSFAELLERSDIVYPLAASTPETFRLVDATALAAMRPGRCSSTCRAANSSTRTQWPTRTTRDGSEGLPWTSGRHRINGPRPHWRPVPGWSRHRTWAA